MTTRYVGAGGNDSNSGLSWAQRKLTLNGVEDTPVEAGDIVYVGAGTYRGTLTCDVDGASGSPITYIGDYTGAHTDGTGGVVRITTSTNDETHPSTQNINGNFKSYRTFQGFVMDGASHIGMIAIQNTNWIIDECYLYNCGTRAAVFGDTANQANITIKNSYIKTYSNGIWFNHSDDVDNAGHVVENCIFVGFPYASRLVRVDNIGGITIRNCAFSHAETGVRLMSVPAAGQTITVNNCTFTFLSYGMIEVSNGYIIEDYNNFFANSTNRSNVSVGANSKNYIEYLDTRWFFEMVNGGTLITPFDVASYSKLINIAGTSPTTADMRGTTVQGTQREWGALEYDSTLDIEAGTGTGPTYVRGLLGCG